MAPPDPAAQSSAAERPKTRPKQAMIRAEQQTNLDELARDLHDARSVRGERITSNTLIRVAIDGLLAHGGRLHGDNEEQLLASWLVVNEQDLPMNPRLLGKPGVGKTTLAYAAARRLGRDAYIMQATLDTRPEDLLITPVIEGAGKLRYVASPLVTAMLRGGVAILDEGNRMSEKSWASLAPLLDNRRYVESIVAGIKIKAHPNFRLVATMNDDASTFELPEYIHSRLQPQIFIDFPERDDEKYLKHTIAFHTDEIAPRLEYRDVRITNFKPQARTY